MRSTVIAKPQTLPPPAADEIDMHTPPEIMAEVLIELMAYVRAQCVELAGTASSERDREAFGKANREILALRTAFDPHDRRAVHAMRQRVGRYAEMVEAGVPPVVASDATTR